MHVLTLTGFASFLLGIQLDASPKPDFAPKSFFLRTVRDKQHQVPLEVFHTTVKEELVPVPAKSGKSPTGYDQFSPPWKLSSRVNEEDKTGIVHLSIGNSGHGNGNTDHFQLPFR